MIGYINPMVSELGCYFELDLFLDLIYYPKVSDIVIVLNVFKTWYCYGNNANTNIFHASAM